MRRFMTIVVAMLMTVAGMVLTTAPAQAVTDYWSGYKRCVVAGHSDYAVGLWWLRTTDRRTMIHGVAWKPWGDAGILPAKADRFHLYQYYNGVKIRNIDLDVAEAWNGSVIFPGPSSALRSISGNNTGSTVPIAHTGAGICGVGGIPGP